jgi:hypothetical protein
MQKNEKQFSQMASFSTVPAFMQIFFNISAHLFRLINEGK